MIERRSTAAPTPVRYAGYIAVAQGLLGLIAAAILLVRGVEGADQGIVNGYGTAGWFAIMGAAVLAAGWALMTGRRWGRGIAVFANLLLLPVSWYVIRSHQPGYAMAVGAVSVAALILLFSPAAVRWAAMSGGPSEPSERATS